jgi:hypothetical protein
MAALGSGYHILEDRWGSPITQERLVEEIWPDITCLEPEARQRYDKMLEHLALAGCDSEHQAPHDKALRQGHGL